jgi:hypothetical protein
VDLQRADAVHRGCVHAGGTARSRYVMWVSFQ